MNHRLLVSLSLALVSHLAAQGPAPTFTALDLGLPGYFDPTGISTDGSVIVGGSYIVSQGNKARRWREGIGFDYPGPSVNPIIASWCSGVSADGTVIAGGNGHAVFGDLEGWMRYGASAGHVGSPAGHDTSDCLAVSTDGAVTVGYGGVQSNPNLFQASRYTEQGGWTNLGFLPGGNDSKATAVNADGSVIAGWSTDGSQSATPAWRWTAATGMVSLGTLPGGAWAQPTCMSADGSVIYGYDDLVAWRWTAATGMTPLTSLGGIFACYPFSCTADGAVVVGEVETGNGFAAFVWDAAHDLLDLRELVLAQGLTQVANWSFDSAGAIAGANPWFIAGVGSDANSSLAFRVSLSSLDVPQLATYDAFGSGCTGSLGAPWLQAVAGSRPVFGSMFQIEVGALPTNLAIMAFGLSDMMSGGVPLPFDLAGIGMPNCELLVDPVVLDTMIGAGNVAVWTWHVPNDPLLAGLTFFNQALSFDPSANTFGFTASNGGAGSIGL